MGKTEAGPGEGVRLGVCGQDLGESMRLGVCVGKTEAGLGEGVRLGVWARLRQV